ncbi:MAG: hypothetical protein WDA21_00405 [Bacilli bacterium]
MKILLKNKIVVIFYVMVVFFTYLLMYRVESLENKNINHNNLVINIR